MSTMSYEVSSNPQNKSKYTMMMKVIKIKWANLQSTALMLYHYFTPFMI